MENTRTPTKHIKRETNHQSTLQNSVPRCSHPSKNASPQKKGLADSLDPLTVGTTSCFRDRGDPRHDTISREGLPTFSIE
jgi:hypothetical protein